MQRKKGLNNEEDSAKPANNQLRLPDLFPVAKLENLEDGHGGETHSRNPNSFHF